MFYEKLTLTFIVFILGMRHGFELDHLAVIDGMVSCTSIYSRLSKWVGILFSLGHGLIIIALTIIIAFEAKNWDIPAWMEGLGVWISILSLMFFGLCSLYSAFKKNQSNTKKIYGPGSFLFSKRRTHSNLSVLTPLLVGMLFSLSFDTLTVTTAFSLNGYALGGAILPVFLGITFMLGMMITDGLNGYFIANLLNRADKRSRYVSRILDVGIGSFSLLTGSSYLFFYTRDL